MRTCKPFVSLAAIQTADVSQLLCSGNSGRGKELEEDGVTETEGREEETRIDHPRRAGVTPRGASAVESE